MAPKAKKGGEGPPPPPPEPNPEEQARLQKLNTCTERTSLQQGPA